jgi:nitrogen fixation protein NifB
MSDAIHPDPSTHPCYRPEAARTWARIHLPVAPRCNVQCNFCDRKYSCVSESRPGVSADVLSPKDALERVDRALSEGAPLSVVGIAGPGDAFANPKATLETLRLVREAHPELLLCLSTNGLELLDWIDEVEEVGVSHLTITVNAVDPEIASRIYRWVRVEGRTYSGLEAGRIVVERQEASLREAANRPFLVKVNSVVVPGVNDAHVGEISRRVAEIGADLHNCIAMIPVAGTPFGNIPEPDEATMLAIRFAAGRHLPQMGHCSRCRADACGLLACGSEGTGPAAH